MNKLLLLTLTFWGALALSGAAPLSSQHILTGPVALAWEVRFSSGVDNSPRALAVSPDGGAVYTAVQVGFSSSQCRVSAQDAATGAELWARLAAGVGFCIPWRLATSPDGSVLYVASRTGTGQIFVEGTLVAAFKAATGAGLWTVLYDGPEDRGFSVADLGLSHDGSRLFLAGNRSSSFSTSRASAFDAATGGLLWEVSYPIPSSSEDEGGGVAGYFGDAATALAVSPEGGRLYVTGNIQSGDDKNDFLTLAYDAATGAQLWEAFYIGSPDSRNGATDVAVSPDGTAVFVTGGGFFRTTSYDAVTAAYDAATGAELWAVRYSGPAGTFDFDSAEALAVSPDGGTVFVAGASFAPETSIDLLAISYDAATGAEEWIARTDVGGGEQAVALALSPGGKALFVTGYAYPGPVLGDFDPDFLTVSYDTATGAELWSARYQGTGSGEDQAVATAVSPDGDTLFVTGFSVGAHFDTVTLAYLLGNGAGFVTGGGWFDSPAGKAHLSLVTKDPRNGAVPEGSASFRLGLFDFRSRSWDRLVVTGNRAVVQGRGTLRGSADEHRFLISVLDAPPGHRAGRDQVRVKIWNTATGAVVYDSQPGAPDDASPATPLGGGSIAIHR